MNTIQKEITNPAFFLPTDSSKYKIAEEESVTPKENFSPSMQGLNERVARQVPDSFAGKRFRSNDLSNTLQMEAKFDSSRQMRVVQKINSRTETIGKKITPPQDPLPLNSSSGYKIPGQIIPPPNRCFFYRSCIKEKKDSPKQISLILNIACSPFIQCLRNVLTEVEDSTIASHSFADWTEKEQTLAGQELKKLNIPLHEPYIRSLYKILQIYQRDLCENRDINYPARFNAETTYETSFPSPALRKTKFWVEIYSNRKINLIFPHSNTHIESGSFKHVYKVFALGKPELRAYAEALCNRSTDFSAANEESCFIKFKEQHWITKVYRLFYYRVTSGGQTFNQQIMEMKYYPNDLFKILGNKGLSRRAQLSQSIQLMTALMNMHEKKMIHRDVKPENILVENDNTTLALSDFGSSCSINDTLSKSKPAGTYPYLSPESIRGEIDKHGFGLDIWAAGCTLWLIWYHDRTDNLYPWYFDIMDIPEGRSPDAALILNKMKQFDESAINPENKLLVLLWNMLRYNPEDRWSARQVLEALEGFQREIDSAVEV